MLLQRLCVTRLGYACKVDVEEAEDDGAGLSEVPAAAKTLAAPDRHVRVRVHRRCIPEAFYAFFDGPTM